MPAKRKDNVLIIHKPSTLFPQWDEKLAEMHVHIEALNKATEKDFKECPIDEETIVMSVVTDILENRQQGSMSALEVDPGYVLDSMVDYFKGIYHAPESTNESAIESIAEDIEGDKKQYTDTITSNITGLAKHYTDLYTLLIERLSKLPLLLIRDLKEGQWSVDILENSDAYVLTISHKHTAGVKVAVF